MKVTPNAPKPKIKCNTSYQIGIIDDDPIAANFMRARLKNNFPTTSIAVSTDPVIPPMLDVYFVDNDFGGQALATALLQEIRELYPNSLVVVMSSTLEKEMLQNLMNGGCNAVYDKNRPDQSESVFEVVRNYLQVLEQVRASHMQNSFAAAFIALRELLHEWNQRLSKVGL